MDQSSDVDGIVVWSSIRTVEFYPPANSVLQFRQRRLVLERSEEEPAARGGFAAGARDERSRVMPERQAVNRDRGAGSDSVDRREKPLFLIDQRLRRDVV